MYTHFPENFPRVAEICSRLSVRRRDGALLLFAIFDRNFSKTVAPPSDGNKNCLAVLKRQSLLKKVENGMKIDR